MKKFLLKVIVFLIICSINFNMCLWKTYASSEVVVSAVYTNLSGDDAANAAGSQFPIGFTFNFYGNNYTQSNISTNGIVNFVTPSSSFSNVAIPSSSAPNNAIYAYWDDLIAPSNSILYQTVGSSPNRKFVTQWTDMTLYGSGVKLGTFQVILYESTNKIVTQYRSITGDNTSCTGGSATIGIENSDGSSAIQYSKDTSGVISSGFAIEYTPSGSTYTKASGTEYYDPIYLQASNLPGMPVLTAPSDTAQGVSANTTFTWDSGGNTTNYTIMVSKSNLLSSPVVNTTTTQNSYTYTLDASTTYYWKVVAQNASGTTSTTVRSFKTGAANSPVLSAINDKKVARNTSTGSIAFTLNDSDTPWGSIAMSAISSNTTVVPNSNITLGGTDSDRTISILPTENQSGETIITISAYDGSNTSTTTFRLVVNNPPTISDIANRTKQPGQSETISFTIGDTETSTDLLLVEATSSNTGIITSGSISLGGSGANRSITYSTVSGSSGTSTITVTVIDALGARTSDTFAVNVNSYTVPAAPTAPNLVAGNGELTVTWTAPANGGSVITGYNVYVGDVKNNISAITGTEYTVTGLTNGQSYSIKVSAINIAGEGAKSIASVGKVGIKPGRPVITEVVSGKASLSVGWNAPENEGSNPITGYNIYVDGVKNNTEIIDIRSYNITGLTNGQTYNIAITAINIIDESDKSTESTGMPKAEPEKPSAPTVISGNKKLTVDWIIPNNNGSEITGYNIYVNGVKNNENQITTTSYMITGLTNDVEYDIKVSAINVIGESEESLKTTKAPKIYGDEKYYVIKGSYNEITGKYIVEVMLYNVEAVSGVWGLKFNDLILKNGVFLKDSSVDFAEGAQNETVNNGYHVCRWTALSNDGIDGNVLGGHKLGSYVFDLSLEDYQKELNSESIEAMDWQLTAEYGQLNTEQNDSIWDSVDHKYKVNQKGNPNNLLQNVSIIFNYDKLDYYPITFRIKDNLNELLLLKDVNLLISKDGNVLYTLKSDDNGVCKANSLNAAEYDFKTEVYGYLSKTGIFSVENQKKDVDILMGQVAILTGKAGKNGKVRIGSQTWKTGEVREMVGIKDNSSKFTFAADDGYEIDKVTIDGVEQQIGVDILAYEHIFSDVHKSSSIYVTFKILNYNISGRIKYVKLSDPSSKDEGTVKLKNQNNIETIATFTQNKNIGEFVAELLPGIYSLEVQKRGYTSYTITDIPVNTTLVLPKDITLIPGDSSWDKELISVIDITTILSGIRKYSLRADINENGLGDIVDLGYAKSNYKKTKIVTTWSEFIQ